MIDKFINFNHFCPLCGEPLHLYMQFIRYASFKATCFDIEQNIIRFDVYKTKYKSFIGQYLYLKLNDLSFEISSQEFLNIFDSFDNKQKIGFLFYVCNQSGIREIYNDYEINVKKICYYRSSLHFSIDNNKIIFPDQKLDNSYEAFSIVHHKNDTQKVYMMQMDYVNDKTILWYYSATNDQMNDDKFRPKLLEKILPALKIRPNLDIQNRSKLISRLDNWILIS